MHGLISRRNRLIDPKQDGELGKVFRGQAVAVAEHRGAEQHGLQLADIARPVVSSEERQRTVGNRQTPQPRLFTDPSEKMARQRRDVLRAFPQGRQ